MQKRVKTKSLKATAEWINQRHIMNYKIIDKETYYRKGVYRHFTEDCKCSTSMTARIDVTELVEYSKKTGTKFYLNFLYPSLKGTQLAGRL